MPNDSMVSLQEEASLNHQDIVLSFTFSFWMISPPYQEDSILHYLILKKV